MAVRSGANVRKYPCLRTSSRYRTLAVAFQSRSGEFNYTIGDVEPSRLLFCMVYVNQRAASEYVG